MEVIQLKALTDNYIHILYEGAENFVAAVDPSEAAPVLKLLQERNWKLTHIFNTHHHPDHIGGNRELKKKTGCRVITQDPRRIVETDDEVVDGRPLIAEKVEIIPIAVPGHTLTHCAFFFPKQKFLFSGDTLFTLGCGRLFEGTPTQMWESLKKLRSLPKDTLVYCGHEYTESNARFALSVDPDNEHLQRRAVRVQEDRARGLSTVPASLELELKTNPFLRADDVTLQAALKMQGRPPVEVFAHLREGKNQFPT